MPIRKNQYMTILMELKFGEFDKLILIDQKFSFLIPVLSNQTFFRQTFVVWGTLITDNNNLYQFF